MAASSPHVSVTRMPYSVRSPADGAAAAQATVGSTAAASALLSPSATGRGLDTHAPAPFRVPETHVALPFAPSPALVASLAPRGAQAGRR